MDFVMGYFSLLLSLLEVLYSLHHPALQFCLIWVGWTLQFIPALLLGPNVSVFFWYSLFQLLQITAALCLTSTLERQLWMFC